MIPVPKLGWMAGVLDLRGKIVRKNNSLRRTVQTVLLVECKEALVIHALSELTGTSPEMRKSRDLKEWMRKSCQEHCPEAHVHVAPNEYERNMPAIGRWTITGAGAGIVLHNVLPYMQSNRLAGIKDELILSAVLSGQGNGQVFAQIKRLQELGWELPLEFRDYKTTRYLTSTPDPLIKQ